MSKKISQMPAKASMVDADEFTILDSEDPSNETKNKRVGRTAALADRQPLVPVGGAIYLGKEPGWTPAGDSATRNVGTLSTEVAAGDAPDAAVLGHTTTINHTLIQTANQKAAADAANSPSGTNAYATIADVPVVSMLHADLVDLATSGHPGTVITIPAGTPGNAINIAADGSLQDAGKPPGAANHADHPDLDTSGHPGTVINIPGGVEGNAVAIAANGTLVDSGIPPGGAGNGGTQKGTPFEDEDILAVQSAAGAGIIKSVGFAPSDVARLSQSNIFASTQQIFQNASPVGLDIFQTGTALQFGRWAVQSATGFLTISSRNDAGAQVEANPEFSIGHGNSVAGKGVILGAATFQGYATINAENGVYDGNNRVYSAGNPPPGGGGGVGKGTPFVAGEMVAVQSSSGDGSIQSVGFTPASVLRNNGTIVDWGENGQVIAVSGNQTFNLNGGHFFYTTAAITADKIINFQSAANHAYTMWFALIDIGGFTPTWQFDGSPISQAEGYNISGKNLVMFTFVKSNLVVVVSERAVS